MEQIRLGALPALTHSWFVHCESSLLTRSITCYVNGIKAFFGGYSVGVLDGNTQKLMQEHPNAWFTQTLHKPLTAFNISIPSACRNSTDYVYKKIDKLHVEGRWLEVKLAYMEDDRIVPIPMYNSDNSLFPICLNGQACRSDTDTIKPGKKIVCRHFAWAYATRMLGPGKGAFAEINTVKKIQSTFTNIPDIPILDAFKYPNGRKDGPMTPPTPGRSYFADGYHFHEETFSEALAKLVEKYWNMAGGDEKNFLFSSRQRNEVTGGHSMALRLKKHEGCMKVIFYDPNSTLMHRTILLSEPGLAAHINREDLRAKHFFIGKLINIDDRKLYADECDVQGFGVSPEELRIHAAPGHDEHPLVKARWKSSL
ncbi:hypothetical protein [Endozoicomonas sp. GU-1]|uniref:hypothetical protein n=2 Tax=Endozoicomonas sp. GU-1 TaxID=3009078 RepID=UPI0022B3B5D9|nr:hypothetical protein [Endozoicomonas sp. GU-1]WBA83866.1 hypothetical protein O2T12_12465 [Endozoicomonas sp. GU-1]